jgi:tetratricopeptide (TPR) repeat protein
MVLIVVYGAVAASFALIQRPKPPMTEPEAPPPTETLDDQPAPAPETTAAAEVEAEPEPEPWTPERVLEWNAYYDLYIALGVLALVFAVSAVKITNSALWPMLQAGRVMASQGAPLVSDPFSYTTETGQRWINIPWLFELANGLIYEAIAPPSLERAPGQMRSQDQAAASTLVAINAVVVVLTALCLMNLRRPGPGLWWAALCAAMAVGGLTAPPTWLALGGLAGQASVAPETWGRFFLALELLLLHRSLNLGRTGAIWVLPVVFLCWANVDDSFLSGLLVLAMAVLGTLAPPEPSVKKGEEPVTFPFRRGLIILGTSLAVCLVNPSFHRAFLAAVPRFSEMFPAADAPYALERLSFFSSKTRALYGTAGVGMLLAFYLIVVGIGLFSFFLNRRRFALGRFLVYAAAAVLWSLMRGFQGQFALVWAATLALNGQEWYQDTFGVEGHLGRGWSLWSVGGRAVTIIMIAAFITKAITGYGIEVPVEQPSGFGVDPDLFPFEAADTLRSAKIAGNVLNTSSRQGDALVWRAYPSLKSFLDSRPHLFPEALQEQWLKLRAAIRDDDIEIWKPILDQYKITVLMIDIASSPLTYDKLMHSPHWILFHDDGNIVLFGRADAPEPDLTYFKEHVRDAEALAYRRPQPVPPPERIPNAVSWVDRIFRSRALTPTQPHVRAAARWLEVDPALGNLPDPTHCLLAIREARIALTHKPDDPMAYRYLVDAYKTLMLNEAAILDHKALSQATAPLIPVPLGTLSLRYMQRVTVLNQAIQTTPPPQSAEEKQSLGALHLELGQLYLGRGYLDLTFNEYKEAERLAGTESVSPQFLQQITNLEDRIGQAQNSLASAPDTQQVDPILRAQRAIQLGLIQPALDDLADAEASGVRATAARPLLIDLYCQVGQPDRASELLGAMSEDPALNTGPGTAAMRQGLVSLLLGNYAVAKALYERAIPRLRESEAFQTLTAAQLFLRGDVRTATTQFLEMPNRIGTQASWEFDLGLLLLEAGEPDQVAAHLTKALTLVPNLPLRPVAAYYLGKLGQPVPPLPEKAKASQGPSSTPPTEGEKIQVSPDQPKPSAPAGDAKSAEPAKANEKP